MVTTVLNKNTDFILEGVEPLSEANAYGEGDIFKSNSLCMKISFNNGLSGDLFYLISYRNTAILADLMMMGDGSAEYEDDHKDALSELGNQIMGAASTAMGTEYGVSIACEQAETTEYGEGQMPFAFEDHYLASITIKIDEFEESNILLVVSPALTESFAAHYAEAAITSQTQESETGEALNADITSDSLAMVGEPVGNANISAHFATTGNANIDMLLDVPLDVTIELGRTTLSIRKVLELGPGSIIELDRKASEPVDLMVNDKVVAKGEVVVVDEYFGIRIVSLVTPEERIKHLK